MFPIGLAQLRPAGSAADRHPFAADSHTGTLAARDRAFRLADASRASAEIPQLSRRVESFMAISPLGEDRGLAQPRKLHEPLTRRRNLAVDSAAAYIAWTVTPQIFEREDAVMAVDPLHSDRVPPNLVDPADFRGRL